MYQRLLLCCFIYSLISVSFSYVPIKGGRHSIKSDEESVSKSEHHDESKEHEVKHKNFDLTPTVVYPKLESDEKHNHKDKNQEDIEHEIKHIFKEVKEDSHGDDKSILIKSDPILEEKSHAKDEEKLHSEDHHKHSDHSLFVSSRHNPSLYHSEEHIDDRDKVDFNVFKIRSHQSEEFDGIDGVHDHKTLLHDNDEDKVDFNVFKQVKDDVFEGRSHIQQKHEAHDITKKHLHHEDVHDDLLCKDTKVIEHSACKNKDYHAPLPHDNHHGHVGIHGSEKHDVGSSINKEKCHDEQRLHDEKNYHFDKHVDKVSEVHHDDSGKSEHKHDDKHLECEPKKPEHFLHHHQDHVHHHTHVPHHDHHHHHTPTIKDHRRDHDFEDSHEIVFSSEEHHHKHHPHVHPHHHDYDYHHHHHPHHYHHNVKNGHHYHH